MSCRCEPHASGSNRCDFCRYEMAAQPASDDLERKLREAVDLLHALACGERAGADEIRAITSFCLTNGFDTPGQWWDKQKRKERAREIDAEIERLRAERAKL